MTAYELVEKFGGEIVRGKARIRQGGEYIIIAVLNGDDMMLTEQGRALASGELNLDSLAPSVVVESAQAAIDESLAEIEALKEQIEAEEAPLSSIESAFEQGLS